MSAGPILSQALRFGLVGGAFSLGYAILGAVLVGPLGAPPFATSVLLYALCIPLAFAAQRRITFGQTRVRRGGFAIYAATQLLGLALVAAVTTRFVTRVWWIDTGLLLATAGLAAGVSFAISRQFAFRPAAPAGPRNAGGARTPSSAAAHRAARRCRRPAR